MITDRVFLRASYWVAAIADFMIAFLIPERMGVRGFVYPMGLMSAVGLDRFATRAGNTAGRDNITMNIVGNQISLQTVADG